MWLGASHGGLLWLADGFLCHFIGNALLIGNYRLKPLLYDELVHLNSYESTWYAIAYIYDLILYRHSIYYKVLLLEIKVYCKRICHTLYFNILSYLNGSP